MGAITLDPLRRVVVKVDQDFLDDNGSVNDAIFTAESIMIIPRRVTRQHKRTVVTQVSTQGVAAIDSQGKSINAAAGSAVKIGDSVVMLVQKGRVGTGKAKFLAQTTDVDRRLDRLSLEFTDPIIDSGLEDLKAKRLDAEGKCLRQTLDVAPAGNRSLVSQALDRVRIDREAKEKKGGDSQGLGRAALDCIQGILGAPPKGLDQLDADQRDQVNAKCLDIAPPAKPPTVHITAPTDGSSVTEGATITIAAETSGGGSVTSVVFTVDGDAQPPIGRAPYSIDFAVPMGIASLTVHANATYEQSLTASTVHSIVVNDDPPPTVTITMPTQGDTAIGGSTLTVTATASDNVAVASVVFHLNGEPQAPIVQPPYTIQITVPDISGPETSGSEQNAPSLTPPLNIQATATDNLGQTATSNVVIPISAAAPTVKITSPPEGSTVREGATITATAEVSDRISTVKFTFGGLSLPALTQAPYVVRCGVPISTLAPQAPSSVPPHVFVGTTSINGAAAADGTVVSAFVEAPLTSTLTLKVTATGIDGQTSEAVRSFNLVRLLPAGEATVTGGGDSIKVVQPSGQSFGGKTVVFRASGQDTGQRAVWAQGVMDLTVGTP